MKNKLLLDATTLALGVALTGSTFMMEAYALTSPTEGYVEVGFNEDDNGDQDIWDIKAGRWDPRANILGIFLSDPSCINHYNPTDNGSSVDEPCAYGPDFGDLFDTVAGEVVYKDAITAGSPPTAGSNGIPDYLDYGGISAAHVADGVVSYNGDTTTFAGSNKNNHPIDTYQWKTGSVPPKDDVSNAYFYARTGIDAGPSPFDEHDGHLLITGGFERISNDGDSHIDIEFNQSAIGLTADGGSTVWYPTDNTPQPTCGGGKGCVFVGERTHNDILVSMDFEKGGDFGILTIHRWDDKGTPDESDDEWVIAIENGGEGCNAAYAPGGGLPPVPADAVCAYNNNGEIDKGPWMTFDRQGQPLPSGGTLPRNAFTEGAMDVNYLLGLAETESPPCISSVTVKTRSSSSFTATLKDFALGAFEICGSVTVVKEATGAVSTPSFGYDTNLGGYSLGGATPDFTLSPDITVAGTTATANTVFNEVVPGNYTITETDAAGFASNATVTCEYAGGAPVTGTYGSDSANFDIQIGEAITCTFSNAQPELKVTKVVNACGTDPGQFGLQIDGDTKTTVGQAGGSTDPYYVSLDAAHTVSELVSGTGVTAASYATTIDAACTDNGNGTGSVTPTSLGLHECTITNTRKPRVTVNKTTVGGSVPTDLELCIGSDCAATGVTSHEVLLDTETSPGSNVFLGPVVKESASDLANYDTIISCNNGQQGQSWFSGSGDRSLDLDDNLSGGDHITCEIVNVYQGPRGCLNPTP
ncbi:MAG: hypothetical protein PVF75_02115 [Granulosicoccaceae bacterium]|jgi:hypothetical protein